MGWFAKKSDGRNTTNTAEPLTLTTDVGSYTLARDNAVAPTTTASVKKAYVAPSPIASSVASPSQASVPANSPVSQTLNKPDEEEDMVVVEAPIENCVTEDYGDIENPVSTSYSKAVDSEQDPRRELSNNKQSHLNSLFNGHLMKWKFEAEEGTAFIRVPACTYSCARQSILILLSY
jgi:hypothetical protein